MEEIELTGGLRTGSKLNPIGAGAPYAKLKVNRDRLELSVDIHSIRLVFSPKDIVSLEPYTAVPIIGKGIKINHNVPSYHKTVIFWTLSDPNTIIKKIEDTGFLSNTNRVEDNTISQKQKSGMLPIKKPFRTIMGIMWNIAIIYDLYKYFTNLDGSKFLFGKGLLFASIIGLFFTLLTLISPSFRKLILSEGTRIEDIKKSIYNALLVFIGFIIYILIFENFILPFK